MIGENATTADTTGRANETPAVPKVSVYMASFNGDRYVAQAIGSILSQTFQDLELVVVDDGSQASTRAILRSLAAGDARMKLHECEHRGLVGTLNHALSLCRGIYVARMDHDDISLPHRLERQVKFLDDNPTYVACGSEIGRMDADGVVAAKRNRRQRVLEHRPDLLPPRVQWMPGPTPMIRADAMRKAGGYRPQFLAAEDRDLCWRLGMLGRCARFNEALLNYRGHATNTSNLQRRTQLFSHILGDMSAIARHFGLDDQHIVSSIAPGGDYLANIAAYRGLLAGRYPVDTLWFHFLIRQGAWPLAGYADRRALVEDVLRHWMQRPLDLQRIALAMRTVAELTVRQLLKKQETPA